MCMQAFQHLKIIPNLKYFWPQAFQLKDAHTVFKNWSEYKLFSSQNYRDAQAWQCNSAHYKIYISSPIKSHVSCGPIMNFLVTITHKTLRLKIALNAIFNLLFTMGSKILCFSCGYQSDNIAILKYSTVSSLGRYTIIYSMQGLLLCIFPRLLYRIPCNLYNLHGLKYSTKQVLQVNIDWI